MARHPTNVNTLTMTMHRTFRSRHLGAITAIAAIAAATLALLAGSALAPAHATGADAATAATSAAVLRQDTAPGLYELVHSPANHAVYVASTASTDGGAGGTVLELDERSLAVRRRIALPLKPYGLAIDTRAGMVYAGHTRDGAVSAIAIADGTVKGTLHHGARDEAGKPVHVRQIVVDEATGQVVLSGITDGGFLWVIDGRRWATERVIRHSDAPTAGLTLDAAGHRLFVSGTAAYAVFDTRSWQKLDTQRIPEKLQASDGKRRFLVNTALDAAGGRLFANQLNNGEGTLVFDLQTGAIVHTIATGDTPVGIRFNAQRNEVYVASRGSGTVSVVDAGSYAIKHRIALPAHPNTLALSPDGQTLFVSVKQPFAAKGQPAPLEQVVRIDLRAL